MHSLPAFYSLYFFYLAAFTVAFSVVIASVPVVRHLALCWGRLDVPCDRKVHQQPMVRLGGVAIFLGTVTAALCLGQLGRWFTLSPVGSKEIAIILAGSGYFALGLWDDLYGLSSGLRLTIQLSIAVLVWLGGVTISAITLPGYGALELGWLSLPATVIWIAGLVNAINWIDGLDGLASGVGAISAVIMAGLALFLGEPSVGLLAVCLVGSLCGFLLYNFNPACIFMGDGGSYFIGFMLAALSIVGLVEAPTVIVTPFIVLAVPIFDMALVIVSRLIKGQSPFSADKSHLHHRLLRVGLSHRWTVLFIYALSLWLGCWAFTLTPVPHGLVAIALATPILGLTTWRAWESAS